MRTLYFNKIHVFQSVRPGDRKTGEELYDEIIQPLKRKHPRLLGSLHILTDKRSFFDILENVVAKEAREEQVFPILHFDMHGNSHGLELTSGEFVSWADLKSYFISISILTNINVLAVMSCCYGAYLVDIIRPSERCPLFAVIGPSHNITFQSASNSFPLFYNTFFDTRSGNEAVRALNAENNGEYSYYNAEFLFIKGCNRYYTDLADENRLQKRIDNIMKEAKIPLDDSKKRQELKDKILDYRPFFERFRTYFFMIDLYPENEKRFPITFEDIIK